MQGFQDFYNYQFLNAANSEYKMQHFVSPFCSDIFSNTYSNSKRYRLNFKSKRTQFLVLVFVYLSVIYLHGCQ